MDAERLTEGEAIALGRRLDDFAAALPPRELAFLITVLHNAELRPYASDDQRTPGDIVLSIHRMRRRPGIGANPQPIPLRETLEL